MATSVLSNVVLDAAGNPLAGVPVEIRLMPSGGFRKGANTEIAHLTRTTTNTSGVWSVALERNADINPDGTYYEITEKIPGSSRRYLAQVGSTVNSLYNSLITVPPAVAVPTALTQEAGDSRYVLAPGSFGGAPDITTVTPGDTADAGSEDAYARIDHAHAAPLINQSHLASGFRLPVVCTSSTRPSSPSTGDQIYETDTGRLLIYYGATTGWQPPWGLPWGEVAYAEVFSSQSSITSTTDLTGLSATWTAITGRKYRIHGSARMTQSSSAAFPELLITNSANTVANRRGYSLSANDGADFEVFARVTPSSGSVTYKLRASTGAGSLATVAQSGLPAFIHVEDIGPVSSTPPSA